MNRSTSKTLRTAGVLALAAHLAAGAQDASTRQARSDVYGIVNLVPSQALVVHINATGQAAFEYIGLDYRGHVGYFDGQRVIHPVAPGRTVSFLGALNDGGELAFLARALAPGKSLSTTNFQPFRWSAARGLVRLPSLGANADSWIPAMNNGGDIVGASCTTSDAASARAVRWSTANRLARLRTPAGFGTSYAIDINDGKTSVGYAEDAAGVAQAMRWDSANRPTVLGTFGGSGATAMYNNERGDIAGMIDGGTPDFRAFLWSPGRGLATPGPHTVPVALNEAGEIAGRIVDPAGGVRAFLYSRARGLLDLHPGSFYLSEVNGLNDSGVSVGIAWPSQGERSAYRWSRTGAAVDLNTRLLNPPAGLTLFSALGIAANGDIIAESSAGLVLLRWGGGGTDAPVLGPIQLPDLGLNRPLRLSLSFRDRNLGERHTATVDWGDGLGPQPAAVREDHGRGEVSALHTFTREGDYTITVRVTDTAGRSTVQYVQNLIRELATPAPVAARIQPAIVSPAAP